MAVLTVFVLLIATGRLSVHWSSERRAEAPRELRRLPSPEGRIELDEATIATSGVAIETADAGRIPLTLSIAGEVALADGRFAHVTPRIAGAIRELQAEIGAEVSAGAALCTIESVELGQARAALVAAVAERTIAERNHERWKQLFEKGLRTQNEYWIAQNQLTRARLGVEAAVNRLKAVGIEDAEIEELERSDPRGVSNRFALRSPIAGVVLDRRATLGEFVDPQDKLFLVGDLSIVWVVAALHQKDLGSVRRGMPALVRVGAASDKGYAGAVTYVGAQVDERTRTVPLRVAIENPVLAGSSEYALRPAMFASVELSLGVREAPVVVPHTAIQRWGGDTIVFVCVSRARGRLVFERRVVVPGAEEGSTVEVVSGLAPGERVATENAHLLASELRAPHGRGAD